MDDKTQGTEQQDQLSDMSRDELDAEIGRLLGVYPVVRFLDEREIEEDESCLLYGGACVCMRGCARTFCAMEAPERIGCSWAIRSIAHRLGT